MDEQKVEYRFEGDVSSLKSSAKEAMSLLNDYASAIKQASNTPAFTASKRATQSMSTAINKTIKDVQKLQDKLNSVGDVKLTTGSDPMRAMSNVLGTIANQMRNLTDASKITTKDLNAQKAAVDAARASMQAAAPSIDNLIAKEQRFQNLLGTVQSKADSFRNTMDNMKTRIAGAFEPVMNRVNSFATSFNNITAKLQSFKDSANNSFSRVKQLADAVASAFRRTSQSADDAGSAESRHSRVSDILNRALEKMRNTLQRIRKSSNDETEALEKMSRGAKSATTALNALNAVGNTAKSIFSTLLGIQLGDWLAQGAKSAIDYVENLNLFTVAMGSSIDKGLEFVDTMSETFGMDPSNLYRYAGYFYQLTDAIGMASDASEVISLSLTKASNDIASLFNVDIETVVNDLASGMQGMTRAVRKYGMDIRATTLQQTAENYGLTQKVQNMSEANRQALRYITMIEQVNNALEQETTATDGTKKVLGDFARNIETPANQLRILKEQMSQLGRAIGNFIVAPLAKALPYINGFVMALRMMINWVAKALGILDIFSGGSSIDNTDRVAESVEGIGDAASGTAKKLKDLVAPFDELNILSEQSGSGGSAGVGISDDVLDPALQKALEEMELKMDNIRMKAVDVRDSILEFLGFDLSDGKISKWDSSKLFDNLEKKFPKTTKLIKDFYAQNKPIIDKIKQFSVDIGRGLKQMWEENIKPLGSNVGTLISAVWETLSKLAGNLRNIHEDIIERLDTLWNDNIQPLYSDEIDGISNLVSIIVTAWKSIISPILTFVGKRLEKLWVNVLGPVCEHIIAIIVDVVDIIVLLWNNVLAPLINWLIRTFGPIFTSIFKGVWTVVEKAATVIGKVVGTVLNVLRGLLDFLVNVFKGKWDKAWESLYKTADRFGNKGVGTAIKYIIDAVRYLVDAVSSIAKGDWKRALTSLANVFVSLGNSIISIAESIANSALRVANKAINKIISGVKKLVNSAGDILEKLADKLGWKIDLTVNWSGADFGSISLPRIPQVKLARGGVVTSPTTALIGEGKYNEAVIPLGNSPQMADMVERIANAVSKNNNQSQVPVEVHVMIGGDDFDAFTYKAYRRGEKLVGAQPIQTGGLI